LSLCWKDAKTCYVLRVPNSDSRGYEFEASNRHASTSAAVSTFDLDQRKTRFEAGKHWTFLPRALEPVAVALGMTRAEASKYLPRATRESFGLRHIFPSDPDFRGSILPRQILVRFNADGRVGELRLLLIDNSATGTPDLLARLREKYGNTAESPSH